MTRTTLSSSYHYVRFSISPPLQDELILRKTLEKALGQSFGVSRAATYIDVLWLADDGGEAIVRVGSADAEALKAAVVALAAPRLSVLQDAPFLPAIIADKEPWPR